MRPGSTAYGTTTNGSQVGYTQAPFAERTLVHGGKQSMPLSYNNTGGFSLSEAERTFDTPQDWTAAGIATLAVYFRGDPNNTTGKLYLKINGVKVAYNGDAAALKAVVVDPVECRSRLGEHEPEEGHEAGHRRRQRRPGHPLRG